MFTEDHTVRHMVEDGDGGPINGDEVLVCPFEGCGKQFKWKKNLQVHIRVNHVNPGAFACTVEGCGLSFGYRHVLARHLQLIHVEGRRHRSTLAIAKNIMGSVSRTGATKRRLESVDDSDPDAVARAVAAAMVDDGGRKAPTNIVKCAFEGCEKVFKGNSNMKAHFRVCHLVCPVIDCTEPTCNAKFSYRHVMLRHYENIHVKGKRSRISMISKRELEAGPNKAISESSGGGAASANGVMSSSNAANLGKTNAHRLAVGNKDNNPDFRGSNSNADMDGSDSSDESVDGTAAADGRRGPRRLEGNSEIPGLRNMSGAIVMNVNTINVVGGGGSGGAATSGGGGGGMNRSNNNIQHYTNRLEAQFLQHPQQQQQRQYMRTLDQVQQQQQQQAQQTLPSLQAAAPFNNTGAMLLQHQAAMLSSNNYQPLQVLSYQHNNIAEGGIASSEANSESI